MGMTPGVLLWRCLLRYGLLVAFSYAFWGVAHLFSWMPLGSELVQLFLVAFGFWQASSPCF